MAVGCFASHVPVERRDEPVSHLDVMPTVAEWLGVPPHPSWQGRSFRERRRAGGPQDAVFLNIQGLRSVDGIVCWPYKLVVDRSGKQAHLFDLAKDPAEAHDVVDAEPAIVAALEDTLTQQFLAQLDYHREDALALRALVFAPRLRTCPLLAPRAP